MGKQKSDQRQPRVTIEGEVLRQIRQHARSNSKTEVCGVLIGQENGAGVAITARIPGLNAAQAGTYVTFTQDTWEHIYRIKDKDFPEARIVGWYHSHPALEFFFPITTPSFIRIFFRQPCRSLGCTTRTATKKDVSAGPVSGWSGWRKSMSKTTKAAKGLAKPANPSLSVGSKNRISLCANMKFPKSILPRGSNGVSPSPRIFCWLQ